MKLFNTYAEAVISNGSTNGVYKNETLSEFCHLVAGGPGMSAYWKPCNPADYLESLESFLASGKLLERGDSYVGRDGFVMRVSCPEASNTPDPNDSLRFVLQDTADQVETPEEKEAFDAIDTTPQQYESLSNTDWLESNPADHLKSLASRVVTTTSGQVFTLTPQQYESLSSSEKPNNQDIAALEEIIRLKEAECEKLVDDKEALLDEITWLHNKLIIEGRRYGASMKRGFIAKMIKDMGGDDHGSK